MGLGHVPQEPIRPEGTNPQFQRRQRRRVASRRLNRNQQGLELAHNQSLGAWGEDLTTQWYTDNGYVIVQRNWRCSDGEIDIIAMIEKTLVMCEVKTRATADFGSPALAVGIAKQQRLRKLAGLWLAQNPGNQHAIRFDVAAVVGPREKPLIDIFEAAF